MYSIKYIFPLFFGTRRSSLYNDAIINNKFALLDKHIEYLNNCPDAISGAIIVINGESPDNLESYLQENLKKQFEVVKRENIGFSYGAWNDAIVKDIIDGNKTDYYFLIEDDYIPSVKKFYTPFVKRCCKNVAYVCCMYGAFGGNKNHAAISNGLISGKFCRNIYEKHNQIFSFAGSSYVDGASTQVDFLKYFEEEGYDFTDILDKYSSPFLNFSANDIKIFGEETNKSLLKPIIF